MKEGWEVKKLGEVCEKLTDGSHNPPKGIDHSDFIMLSSQNVFNDCLLYDDVRFLQEEDFNREDKRTCVREGDVLLTIVGTIGRCSVFVGDRKVTLQRSVAVLHPLECIIPRFLMYSLIGNKSLLNEHSHGIAQKGIYLKQLSQIPIPLPPLPEQEKIVAELDCLSGIIEKKKQQLKELDALAQSIFYEMFGDPVENEKGWEVKKLGKVSEVTSFKRVLIEDVVECGVPFIRGTELSALSKLTNSKNFPFTLFITPEHYERVKAISGVPTVGDLLIPSINSEGVVWVLDTDEPRYYKDGRVLWVHTNHQYNESIALKYIISNKLRLMYKELASGATFIELKLFVLREMELPFPPLSLQHSFASKVEAIERQKELIKQSISETETLFNARMQHYFG